jgi:hypothetical protein
MFEDGVLRKELGAEMWYIKRVWRELHNWKLHAFYSTSHQTFFRMNKSVKMRWAGNMAGMGVVFRVLVGRTEGNSQLGRLSRRWDEVSQ